MVYMKQGIHLRTAHGYLSVKDFVSMSHRITEYMPQKKKFMMRNCVSNSIPVNRANKRITINPMCSWALHNSILTGSVGMFKIKVQYHIIK